MPSSNRCYHVGSVEIVQIFVQGFTAICTKCGKSGPGCGGSSRSSLKALDDFWSQSAAEWNKEDTEKETPMNSDYRRGVEDAMKSILFNLPLRGLARPLDVVNAIPGFLRKSLLTKKVTKWVRVFNSHGTSWTGTVLYDSKEEAEDNKENLRVEDTAPIEIEVPIE